MYTAESRDQFGFSIKKYAKKAVRGVKAGVKAAARTPAARAAIQKYTPPAAKRALAPYTRFMPAPKAAPAPAPAAPAPAAPAPAAPIYQPAPMVPEAPAYAPEAPAYAPEAAAPEYAEEPAPSEAEAETAAALGFSIKRGLKKVGRGVKKAGKGAAKGAVKVGKVGFKAGLFVAKIGLLPYYLLLKASKIIGKAVCAAPPAVLTTAATAANVNTAIPPAFCQAMRTGFTFTTARKLLPGMVKTAVKLSVTGAFPPAGPALRALKYVPGLSQFAGEEIDGALGASMETVELLGLADLAGALDPLDIALLGLTPDDLVAMRRHLQDTEPELAAALSGSDRWMGYAGVGITALLLGVGIYLGAKDR